MKKLSIRSNRASACGFSGYAPRVSYGTLEEINGFQHFLMNTLDVYHIPFTNVECGDSSLTFINEDYQQKVEFILFCTYKNRFMIDLS